MARQDFQYQHLYWILSKISIRVQLIPNSIKISKNLLDHLMCSEKLREILNEYVKGIEKKPIPVEILSLFDFHEEQVFTVLSHQ